MINKAFKTDVDIDIQNVKTQLESLISQRVKISDMGTYLSKHDEAIVENRKKFVEVAKRIREFKETCANVSIAVGNAVTTQTYTQDINALRTKFKECIQYHHLQKHLDYINPTVNECLAKGE